MAFQNERMSESARNDSGAVFEQTAEAVRYALLDEARPKEAILAAARQRSVGNSGFW